MNANDLTTIDQVCAFMSGTQRVVFEVAGDKQGRYDWVRRTLVKFDYSGCGKADRGVLISYLMKVSSYSRAQVKRLIKRYRETGRLTPRQRTVRGFTRRYTKVDIRLLAAMDERHNTPNGLTLKKLCERAYAVFGQAEYERLAGISVSHLYNLRQSQTYRRQRHTIEKTRPVTRDIGARRKPQSDGQPGTIRIDTVHQGDLDGEKGVYHINAVDEVTQFEVVVSVEKISEYYLIPALEHLLASFPVRHPGVPRRQRLGIHQPAGRPAAGETAYRVHQVPRPAQQRQRPGGMQERSCRAQAARPCPYPATLGWPAQ